MENLHIYNEIAKVSQGVFENIIAEVGTYAPADVENIIKEKGIAAFADGYEYEKVLTVEVGTFSCSFRACDAFTICRRVATAWEIKSAFRAKFTRKPEQVEPVVTFTVPKSAKEVTKAIDSKSEREVMRHVCIDTEKRAIIGTEGHVLTVVSVPEMVVSSEAAGEYLVRPELLKSGKGTLTIDADGVSSCGDVVADTYKYGNSSWQKFPNWRSVCPRVCIDYAIYMGDVWKEFAREIKAATKVADKNTKAVTLHGEEGEKYINIEAGAKVARFELSEPLKFGFCTAINGERIKAVPNAEELYVTNIGALVFVWRGGFSLVMPSGQAGTVSGVGENAQKKSVMELCGIDAPQVAPVAEVVPSAEVVENAKPAFDTVLCLPEKSSYKTQLPAVCVGEYKIPANPFASRWAQMPEVPQFADVVQYTEDGREILPEPPAVVYIDIDALQTQDAEHEEHEEEEKKENVFSMFTNWLFRVAAVLILLFCLSANTDGVTQEYIAEPQTFTESAQDAESAQAEEIVIYKPLEVSSQQAAQTQTKVVKRKRAKVADTNNVTAHDDEVVQPVGSICMVAAFYISPKDAQNVYGRENVLQY